MKEPGSDGLPRNTAYYSIIASEWGNVKNILTKYNYNLAATLTTVKTPVACATNCFLLSYR